MSIKLNHTIVYCKDKVASANFLVEILGLASPKPFSHFLSVELANDVTLDFANVDHEFSGQHYAFLVSEEEFDKIFERIKKRSLQYWADPFHQSSGEINRRDNGRGLYFNDPSGHNLEILTRPYGS